MEKSHNYPHLPPQMSTNAASSSDFSGQPAPPSYTEAITGVTATSFPPVQVLPTPDAPSFAGNAPQRHQPQNTQVFVSSAPNVTASRAAGSGHTFNPPRSYPTQQQSVHQPHMMQQPVVIIQQQAVLPLGPEATYVLCPICHVQGMTRISHEPSSKTHLVAALLCIFGFWCCACLPYCVDSCMSTNHYCGNCNKFLGTYANSL